MRCSCSSGTISHSINSCSITEYNNSNFKYDRTGIAFIVSDPVNPRPKLLTQLCVDIGKLAPNTSKTIRFHVISFDEGTIEISQLIKYQTANAGHKTQMPQKKEPIITLHDRINHNVSFEYANNAVIKSKKTTITIPCSAEFLFTGKFYSLDKSPLMQAYTNEDFLFRTELVVKSVDIDILDMYLLSVSTMSTFLVQLD